MKLLLITQVVDTQDPGLSFMTQWISEFALRYEHIHVICLKEGIHELPKNVTVHSLGKEEGGGRVQYTSRLFQYAWKLRAEYDAVFVHMNQEYILLAGWLWVCLRKPIYMWRNHYAGTLLTDIAAFFCTKVFCTSKHSYTARYRKTSLMPVGIDLERFGTEGGVRTPRSILFLARIAPSKRPEMLIDALGEVLARGVSFTAAFYGSPIAENVSYYDSLNARTESLGLHDRVRFYPGIPNDATSAIYKAHDIFVNCSPSGMFDKTIFEAAACGCRVIAASEDFRDAVGEDVFAPDTATLTEQLISYLSQSDDEATRMRIRLQAVAREESLGTLADRLLLEMS
jgi:glycosyltransferase involved in cell wall biosynthesis